ncbi:peptidyl-prolyl cis-trans isomerase SurA [Blastococcus xanthinilyticus]|uniref:peptidylprolyl isomerase n=1 Tax=Blastococcus xanthinilyticus TaxID=1564164 RepID=A0A5S5CQT3_9ACTN|nr:peptidyl-prolyl cis-trans isomerase SurA [Blastococcus xanthinilyticus]
MVVSGFLLAVTVSGLSACRSAPDVAAYVGDEQISVDELEAAVAERLSDEYLAPVVGDSTDELTRRVLGQLLEAEVHDAAAGRYDVSVSEGEVTRQVELLLGDDDPEQVYEQLAQQQGATAADLREGVRQLLLRREIAAAQGGAEGLEETALRARYDEVREQLAQVEFGYVTVPDQATADAVAAELTANPAGYPAVAARFPGQYTLAELDSAPAAQVPPALGQQLVTAAPGTAFTVPVPEAGGVVVAFRAGTTYPSFEELRPQLEAEAGQAVEEEVQPLLADVRDDLGITVNPRYGVLGEDGRLAPPTGGVVDIVGDGVAGPSAD